MNQLSIALLCCTALIKATPDGSEGIEEDRTIVGLPITKNNLLATVPIWGKNFGVTFQLWIGSFNAPNRNGWTELLKVTATGNDCCSPGDRIPAVYVNKGGYIHVATQIGTNGNSYKNINVKPKTWTKVEIKQYQQYSAGKWFFEVFIDRKSVFKTENSRPMEYKNVKIYTAQGNVYPVADARIQDLEYGVCSEPGFQYLEGSCYGFIRIKTNWESAYTYCNRYGNRQARPASINSKIENDFVASELYSNTEKAWIGGSYLRTKRWAWIDGSRWSGYTNWMTGEPNNVRGAEDKIMMYGLSDPGKRFGKWNDISSGKTLDGVVCEYKANKDVAIVGIIPWDTCINCN